MRKSLLPFDLGYLFLFILFLFVFVGPWIQAFHRLTQIVFSELLFLLPALLYLKVMGAPVREMLMLEHPTGRLFASCFCCGVSLALLAEGFFGALQKIHGVPSDPFPFLELSRSRKLWTFLVLVVVAPICEELLFRGFAIQSLRVLKFGSSLLSGFYFALFHPFPRLFFFFFFQGMMLAWITLRSGNVVASMIAHAAANATTLGLLMFRGEDPTLGLNWSLAGAILFAFGYFLLPKSQKVEFCFSLSWVDRMKSLLVLGTATFFLLLIFLRNLELA